LVEHISKPVSNVHARLRASSAIVSGLDSVVEDLLLLVEHRLSLISDLRIDVIHASRKVGDLLLCCLGSLGVVPARSSQERPSSSQHGTTYDASFAIQVVQASLKVLHLTLGNLIWL